MKKQISLFTFLLLIPGFLFADFTKNTTVGTSPSTRSGHSAVYDTTNNLIIIFGGDHDGTFLNDVYTLNTANGISGASRWTTITTSGDIPNPRLHHTAIYDSSTNRMIIYGGTDGFALDEIFVLINANGLDTITTATWAEITTSGSTPHSRYKHSAVYDSSTNRMIIFGGGYGTASVLNDVWVLINANGIGTPTWLQLTTAGSAPTARLGHTAVLDQVENKMYIFGGGPLYAGDTNYNDTWCLTNANGIGTPSWTQLTTNGSIATTRQGHTAAYLSTATSIVVYGGTQTHLEALDDVHKLEFYGAFTTWSLVTVAGTIPSERNFHANIYDSTNNKIIIFGGSNTEGYLNDTWILVPE